MIAEANKKHALFYETIFTILIRLTFKRVHVQGWFDAVKLAHHPHVLLQNSFLPHNLGREVVIGSP